MYYRDKYGKIRSHFNFLCEISLKGQLGQLVEYLSEIVYLYSLKKDTVWVIILCKGASEIIRPPLRRKIFYANIYDI